MECNEFYRKYLGISEPYSHQKQTWESFESGNFPLLIKAPTGSGKTEAVVAPFLSQFLNNKFHIAPRLIYVLPIRVLVNSIAQRIEMYAKKISSHCLVKIQHGDIPDSPFFMGDIVVTTLDQFVYGFARTAQQVGHHIDMPAGAIASSVVIFDEAHMYRDGFTFSIMRALMEVLNHTRIPFVLMTATMPDSLKHSLFEKIHLPESNIIEVKDFATNSRISISLKEEPLCSENEININEALLKEIKSKKSLIILNQVKKAQNVYEYLKNNLGLIGGKEITLLHSRFTRIDRQLHESEALRMIPHREDRKIKIPEGTGIVVSTQVLEAGLDFSAEIILTELAPADSLVQRAGRCARYQNETGKMYIFKVEDTEKNYLPYEKEHLWKSWHWLCQNPDFNIKSFNEVCEFVNVLDYKADDFAAADTLIDLYECVLYADTEPRNIQVREGKIARLIVVKPVPAKSQKEKILNALKAINIKEQSLDVDIKIVWGLFKQGLIKWELVWKYENSKEEYEMQVKNLLEAGKKITDKDTMIGPFRTYILEDLNYNSEKGIINDEGIIT